MSPITTVMPALRAGIHALLNHRVDRQKPWMLAFGKHDGERWRTPTTTVMPGAAGYPRLSGSPALIAEVVDCSPSLTRPLVGRVGGAADGVGVALTSEIGATPTPSPSPQGGGGDARLRPSMTVGRVMSPITTVMPGAAGYPRLTGTPALIAQAVDARLRQA
jgi:hypothetical protein